MYSLFGGSSKKKRVINNEYIVGATIGEGASSKVKRGREILSGRLVALKIMDPETFRSKPVQQELEILRYFGQKKNRHPNVSGLVALLHDVEYKSKYGKPKSKYDSRRVSVIVTEYVDGGDLFSYVSSGIPFNEETAQAVFQQVVRGVSHIHKHGVVHLDLKPENILMGKNGIVKITDFGLSEIVKPLKWDKKQPQRSPRASNSITRSSSLQDLPPRAKACSRPLSVEPPPSPLFHFFPSASPTFSNPSNGTFSPAPSPSYARFVARSRSPSSLQSGSDVDDDALFEAITQGRTRESSESIFSESSETSLSVFISTIKYSSSMTAMSTLASKGLKKVASSNSVSSLESSRSLASKVSCCSRTNPKYASPKLVVNSRSGTLSYQAPEVARGYYDGCKADVYSLGVVLHVMLYGVLPYEQGEWHKQRDYYQQHPIKYDENGNKECEGDDTDTDDEETFLEWTEPRLLSREVELSDEAQDLLMGALCLAEDSRFTLKDVKKHKWVAAAKLRGSVRKAAAVVKRREPYVEENLKNQSYLRKARKRGYGPTPLENDMYL
mmetsp:Transcript_8942/g.14545  ORF Transcript_8942/g.14545 Transcript_8942/m.14545 type:complete len:554 (+) Transcript_8942:266-1927(+)|eukprot:CAMPEP_0203765126 /NCGR_PEP_ID=MMETSP0098-20131031/18242_1 /ASSEMBLY_ACC=CAM_ASM_000208 /TAXON_ID=96639 /ORGANISM=" , Strain NY0313808BC1" /LENGTH=553 /DNA_ID=CAMNT_0050661351 /DNA_START=186 /DNA_END=1847 /DNA_ORIENTATION=+